MSTSSHWYELIAFLSGGAGGLVCADKIIETHAAQIFLIGDHAFKIKKPVNLGYLDFSTLENRQWALRRELERNRKNAPEIYLKVSTVRRAPDGMLRLEGKGEIVDYVLVMRRFSEDALLSDHPELTSGDLAEKVGRYVARFHANALTIRNAPKCGLSYSLAVNDDWLGRTKSLLGAEDVGKLIDETNKEFSLGRHLIEERESRGFVRRCHGDLHLRNIFLQNDDPILFDCIEFDDRLSDIDVLYDLAFLVMDVLHNDQAAGANRLVNAYLEEAIRRFGI